MKWEWKVVRVVVSGDVSVRVVVVSGDVSGEGGGEW